MSYVPMVPTITAKTVVNTISHSSFSSCTFSQVKISFVILILIYCMLEGINEGCSYKKSLNREYYISLGRLKVYGLAIPYKYRYVKLHIIRNI